MLLLGTVAYCLIVVFTAKKKGIIKELRGYDHENIEIALENSNLRGCPDVLIPDKHA